MPNTDSEVPERRSIWAATPIVIVYWVSGIILNYSNASIIHVAACPTLIAAFQMAVAAVLVQPAKCLAPEAVGPSPDACSIVLRVLPASILLACSMVFENLAHGVLSLGVIHIIGCSHPALTYLMSSCAGTDNFACPKLQALVIIYLGAAVAGGGFSGATPPGVLMYVVGSLCDCGNALLLGVLLSAKGLKLDPFKTLSYYAAISSCCLALVGIMFELPEDMAMVQAKFNEEVGIGALLLNGVNAFVMQLSILVLVYRTDAVTFMVFSLIRGMVMDAFGALAFGQPVTVEELVGYLAALIGVQVFNLVRTRPEDFDSIGALLDGLLRSAQGLVFEVSSAQQKPAARALASKKAFNNELDDELDRELQPTALPQAAIVAARSPSIRREPSGAASPNTEFFEIGDVHHDEGEEFPPPTG